MQQHTTPPFVCPATSGLIEPSLAAGSIKLHPPHSLISVASEWCMASGNAANWDQQHSSCYNQRWRAASKYFSHKSQLVIGYFCHMLSLPHPPILVGLLNWQSCSINWAIKWRTVDFTHSVITWKGLPSFCLSGPHRLNDQNPGQWKSCVFSLQGALAW